MPRKNTIQDFWNQVEKTATCWLWKGSPGGTGYGWFSINKINWTPHRFSYTHHKGPIPKGQFVCHTCDNPLCVNPDHLWLGTLQDNHRDMMNKGRHGHGQHPGSLNPSAKLTEQQVLEIRALPGPHWKIAQQYGVSKCTIDEIRARTTWRHI